MKLVMLYGPPAVGKLTVAQALAARTGFRVLHNHLLVDLSHALFGYGTLTSRALTHRLRATCLEAAREAALPGLILTYVYARDRDDYILGLCEQAELAGDDVCLVRLTCGVETLEARVADPSRTAFNKLTSVTGLRGKLAELSEPFGAVAGRESLGLRTDEMTPDELAEKIEEHFGLG